MRRHFNLKLALLLLTLIWSFSHTEAQHTLTNRIITLGNTADLSVETDFYENLRLMLSSETTPTALIVNGDFTNGAMNLYEDSLKIAQLLGTVKGLEQVNLIIVPGDRDWANSGSKGWEYIQILEDLVNDFDLPNVQWPIKNGCPGPKEIPLGDQVLLVTMQTQWWNHPFRKPTPGDADCKIDAEENFNEELEDIIDENNYKNIVLVGHLPIISYGPYGGKWPWHKYMFPIPVLSGLSPAFHSNVGNPQDISNHRFSSLRDELLEVMEEHHQLIYLSAHEHNLQILKYKDHYLINSGSPSNAGYTGRGRQSVYAESQSGLIEIRYYDSGQSEAVVHGITDHAVKEIQRFPLYQSNCEQGPGEVPISIRSIPCEEPVKQVTSAVALPATISLSAGNEYKANKIKESWFGKHYRDSWTTQVTVPYLNMDTTFQGLNPYQKGGGRQTISLKIKAGDGSEYVFRSVNKDPTKALDYEYRETVIGRVVRDQTSSQQPYGAMAIDELLNNIDILHASPKLYVLPQNGRLGSFKEDYAGLFGMLEERPTNPKKVENPFANADAISKSYEMFRQLYDDHDNKVNTEEFVRARVFDLLVGDWGKHEDNWKWAGYKGPHGMSYRPIPRDRDHVFSLWDGILPWIADREWAKPSAANFDYQFKGIKSLMWQARHLDRFIANELSRDDWINAAKFVQQNLDDEKIDKAVENMPPEIMEGDGKIIAEKLKQRLNNLDQAASTHYDILAKEVDVIGSNKRESFEVYRSKDGFVDVTVFDVDSTGLKPDSSRKYYHRRFLPSETKEIRLFGLQKKDQFHVFGETNNSIPVRIIGGPGADRIYDESKVRGKSRKTLVYEQNKQAQLDLGTEGKLINHWDPEIHNYDRTAFKYSTYFPSVFISSSKDFGIGLKGGVHFTNQRFGKQDYSSKHSIQLAFSTENINVIDYKGRFRHVLGKWDLTMDALAADHFYFTYFFGFGNDTKKDQALFDEGYYRTTYNSYQLSAGLNREIWNENKSQVGLRLHYENNEEQIGENTILKDPEFDQDVLGVEDTNILEAIINLDLDFRDKSSLPERGMRVYLQHQSGIVSSNDYKGYSVSQASLEGFITAYLNRPVTLGVKFGGSKSYGEVPFYKLKYLGQSNDLRGFLRNRFTGKSTLFFNTELRWELSEFRTALFPIRFGLKAFYDTGRVYSVYDKTDKWHYGVGGGVYLIPLKEEVSLNLSLAFSDEESGLLLLGIGKAF